jgi:hypothetical protein
MIAEFAQDLIDKIKTVPALGNRIGLAAAGGATDPSMSSVPLPAGWILFEGENLELPSNNSTPQDMIYNFSLALMLSYSSQLDLINTQIPTIEAIARSVSGKESTSQGSRWFYNGAQLVDVFNDRLVYELSFMVKATYV